jgi:NADPH-dependent glutamate synthase beta subunit-like oxidoreductase
MKSNGAYGMTTEGYSLELAIAEADRCLLCHDAPCSKGCPAGTDPGAFIRKLRLKSIKGAIRTIKTNNILGGVCGVACPVERLCEKECSMCGIDRAIEIGKLQRFLVEHGWATGFNPLAKGAPKKAKIAIVGSGPAGLSCAAQLAQLGYDVTVFEAKKKLGGVIRHGVPAFRLSDGFVDRELKDLAALGVAFKPATEVKGPIPALLKKGFKAVFVATGLGAAYRLPLPGANLKGVTTSADFLCDARTSPAKAAKLVKGKNVLIVGGGSVAMDVAETAKTLKAKKVYCVALEAMTELPSTKVDLDAAITSGVIIRPQTRITEIVGKGGAVAGVKGTETEWIKPGLLVPSNAREATGTDFSLKVEAVIFAIGSGASPALAAQLPKVKLSKRGLIEVNKKTMATSVKGVYAGGDVVRGAALIVDAVADGKTAATAIDAALAK